MGELPSPVWNALVRLERSDLDPVEVAFAMRDWRRTDALLARGPAPAYSDDLEQIGPHARELLEAALSAMHGRARRQLSQLVRDLDERIQGRTMEDPGRPAGPWWWRILVTE